MEKYIEFKREVNQELFFAILEDIYKYIENNFSFENDIFYMQMYNWEEKEEYEKPNFWHKPSNFKIWWYKYPMRSAECNMNITNEQFLAILYDCKNSLDPRIIHEINKWWEDKL